MKKILYLLGMVISFILIHGCGNGTDDSKLQEGTPAYQLADQLSNTLEYLDPDDNNPLVSTNKFKITTGEMIQKIQLNMGNRAEQLTKLNKDQLKSTVDKFTNAYAERKLFLSAARETDIEISEAEIDSVLTIQYTSAGGKENFEQFLQSRGHAIEQVKNDIEEGLLIQRYLEENVSEEVQVSEEDIQTAYQEDQSVTMRHILLNSEGKSDSEKAELRDKMEDILERAKSGEDFANLANQYSEDPGSKNNGGLYRGVRRDQMVEEFEEVAFSVPVGGISDVFETQFGYHILTVLERQKETEPLDKVHDKLKNQIHQKKYNEAYQEILAELKKRYDYQVIEYSI